jgi:glycosyltransferase involved in cell wall biosynthesis
MKILYVYHSLAFWGGIERILVDKMNNLVNMYYDDVYLLTTDQGDHPLTYSLNSGVHLKDLGIRYHRRYQYHGLKRLWMTYRLKSYYRHRLSEQLYEIRPDVIVCTTSRYVDIELLTELKGSTPLVVESHSICKRTFGQGGLYNIYLNDRLRKSLLKAQAIVALTEQDAADWRIFHPTVNVIPNMVNQNEGAFADLCQHRVIFVGRFDYQKQPMEMIRIWEKVYQNFPDWHLDLYGEGEERRSLEMAIASLGMNIHVHPPTPQIYDCYRQHSILVSTSLFEPFGLVIPEAMSCGLPVVAYDGPYGPSELLHDGKTGFLIPCNNQEAFANRLTLLMGNLELRQRIGQCAVISSKRFQKEHIMPLWHTFFEQIIK